MWCEKCQADVAGIASTDNERMLCTKCGTELVRTAPAGTQLATDPARSLRDPRELIARWAQEDALDRIEIGSPVTRDPVDKQKPVRFDGSHPVQPAASSALTDGIPKPSPAAAPSGPAAPAADPDRPVVQDVVIHRAHETNAPHFTAIPVAMSDKSTRWVTMVGQILAYLGVGGLTIGTSLVLMGYFGGPSSLATTGWLVSTAGQMLLFLGVVTLVSSGMEQTTQEVVRRIDTLGERLGRIEEVAFTGKSHAPSQAAEVPK
jgi:hypothetical protein